VSEFYVPDSPGARKAMRSEVIAYAKVLGLTMGASALIGLGVALASCCGSAPSVPVFFPVSLGTTYEAGVGPFSPVDAGPFDAGPHEGW
jgi:hypothetical protein